MSKAFKVCSNKNCDFTKCEVLCPLCETQMEYFTPFISLCRTCKKFFASSQIGKPFCSNCQTYALIFVKG